MSDQNIFPSAPPLYPSLTEDFRLKKICDCQKELENEISHYQQISKKYKRAKSIADAIATPTGILTFLLSSSGLAVSLSGIGVVVGAPLAEIAGLMGMASTAVGVGSGRFNKKITKHEKTVSLAEAKHLSISRLISKALNDGSVSDQEFDMILREVEQYGSLKAQLRSEARIKPPSSEKVDVEAIKEEIKNEYRKKFGSPININS